MRVKKGDENPDWNSCMVGVVYRLQTGMYNNAVLGCRRIRRQALCIALSVVFFCEFLFALSLLRENGAYAAHIAGLGGHQGRSSLARWVGWKVGAAAMRYRGP